MTFGKDKTIAFFVASSDAAPQLVKLSEPKPLPSFNQHNCCIGHINSDFHNRGGNQNINTAAFEFIQDFIFYFCALAAVQKAQSKPFKNFFKLLKLSCRSLNLFHRFNMRLFNEWANNENLNIIFSNLLFNPTIRTVS